jgi:di/tricarboxylate transporter
MSDTAALLMLPIAIAMANESGLSAMPFIIGAAIASHAASLTPVVTPMNLLVPRPAGYQFTDYTRFGLSMAICWLVVIVFIVPLYWRF